MGARGRPHGRRPAYLALSQLQMLYQSAFAQLVFKHMASVCASICVAMTTKFAALRMSRHAVAVSVSMATMPCNY